MAVRSWNSGCWLPLLSATHWNVPLCHKECDNGSGRRKNSAAVHYTAIPFCLKNISWPYVSSFLESDLFQWWRAFLDILINWSLVRLGDENSFFRTLYSLYGGSGRCVCVTKCETWGNFLSKLVFANADPVLKSSQLLGVHLYLKSETRTLFFYCCFY